MMGVENYEFPDEAGYPDGVGFLDESTTELAAGQVAGYVEVPLSAYDVRLIHEPAHSTYAAWIDGQEAAAMPYRKVAGRIVLLTTTVQPEFRGKGVATEFVGRVLDELRQQPAMITVYCPLVRSFIDAHPQYAGMVDPQHPGISSGTPPEG